MTGGENAAPRPVRMPGPGADSRPAGRSSPRTGRLLSNDGQSLPSRVTSRLERLAELNTAAVLTGCLAMIAVVGLTDCLTGPNVSLSIFYLVPAVFAATKGRRLGTAVAGTAATTGFVADMASQVTPDFAPMVSLWNAIVRLVVLGFVAVLVDALLDSARQERQIARRDHLTGLQNPRAFTDSARAGLRGLVRTGRPLTLAYIDIDRFKTVNDQLGHAAGDAVLVGTARILMSAMRDVDTAARIGGDEFVVLLPETDSAQAQVAMGRIHRLLVEQAAARGWDVGFSIGVVTFTSPPGPIEAMVAEVDRILYEVKQSEKGTIRYATA